MRKSIGAVVAVVSVGLTSAVVQAERIYAISTLGSLVWFDSASPGSVTTVGPLSGLTANHTARAIDFRPADQRLYLLSSGRTGVTNNQAQLYTVDLATASVSTVGSGLLLSGSTSNRISMDFDPVADQLRVVTGTRQNYRVSPLTGSILATDSLVAYAPEDPLFGQVTPVPGDIAYTNNVPGATSATLYYYEYALDTLATMGSPGGSPVSPNAGTLFTVGDTGLFDSGFLSDENTIGFDISGITASAYVTTDLVNISTGSGNLRDDLFRVDLATGQMTRLGSTGLALIDSAVFIPEPGWAGVVGVGVMLLGRRRR